MTVLLFIGLILACVAAIFINRRPIYTARKAFYRADYLINHAEAAMHQRDYDLALVLYGEALDLAPISGCALFQAEAHYGMARVHEKRGQLQFASEDMQNALANREDWEGEKPNFAVLIENELKRVHHSLGR